MTTETATVRVIRMISADFTKMDRDTFVSDAVLDMRAQRILRLKGENRYRQMAVDAVESGGVEENEKQMAEVWERIRQQVLTDSYDGAKFDDLNEVQKAEFHKDTGWFRSNKSVIVRAIKAGVDLLDANNYPRGKSEVETAIQALKREPEDKDPLTKFTKRLDSTTKAAEELDDKGDLASAIKLAEALVATLKEQMADA